MLQKGCRAEVKVGGFTGRVAEFIGQGGRWGGRKISWNSWQNKTTMFALHLQKKTETKTKKENNSHKNKKTTFFFMLGNTKNV